MSPVTLAGMDEDVLYSPPDLEVRWPALWQKALGAIDQLVAPVLACRHVVFDGTPAILCADHPQAGLFCPECIERQHGGRRHDSEWTCGACGKVLDVHDGGVGVLCSTASLDPAGLEVRNPAGDARRIDLFVVASLGVCAACLAAN